MGASGKLAAALQTARITIEAANAGCPYGSYRSYDCSSVGVIMPDRITPVEHTEINSLFSGACVCSRCQTDHRAAVETRGGWSGQWDQNDLRDAVVYAAEIYGDEWGWKLDSESVNRQMDEVAFVGFQEMDPRDYADLSGLGGTGDAGWMKDEPPEEWADKLRYEHDRSFGHIVESWLVGQLSPAVFFEGVGEGDGRGRALFSHALGMPLKAAIFRYDNKPA